MCSYLGFVLLAIAMSATASGAMDFDKCMSIIHSEKHCCAEPLINKTSIIESSHKECKLMPQTPGSCERAICFGTKLGVATDDGIIKMDALKKHLDETFSDYNDILEAVKTECFEGSYETFGESDECDLKKMLLCIHWQYFFRCPNINDEDSCKGFKDDAAECLKLEI